MKRTLLVPLLALAASLALHACGGGGSGSASNPAPQQQVAAASVSGTVTGMASLVIDGVEYTDATTTVTKEVDPANPATATTSAFQVGQHVEFNIIAGALGSGAIRPRILGPVESKGANSITVLGQTVNVSASIAPVTTFGGGYSALSGVTVGDVVEVHGTQNADFSVAATRIEKQATPVPGYVVVGTIDPGATATAFGINGHALAVTAVAAGMSGSTILVPAGASLAAGEVVTVYAPVANLTGTLGSSTTPLSFAAAAIRVHMKPSIVGQVIVEGGRVRTATPAAPAAPTSFTIDDFTVLVPSTGITIITDGKAGAATDIVLHVKVIVQGVVQSDGSLQATKIWVNTGAAGEALLVGPIQQVDATHKTFQLRHTTVDYSSATLGNGTAANLVADAYVLVTGAPGATGVIADTITFLPLPPGFGPGSLPAGDLPSGWNFLPPPNAMLPPVGTAAYGGEVSALSTTGSTTSFTLTDREGVAVTVNETATTKFLPANKSAADVANGCELLVFGVPNAAGTTVDASVITLLR